MAILTLRHYEEDTMQQLEKLGLLEFFDKIVLVDPRKSKNNAELKGYYAKEICRELKVKTNECCMVGDSISDLEAGSKMNAVTVGVTCGLSGEKSLSKKCSKVIASVHEILDLI